MVQEWPVGWLPDGGFLYTVPGREYAHRLPSPTASGKSGVLRTRTSPLAGWPVCGHRQSYLRRALGGGYQLPDGATAAGRWPTMACGSESLWSPDGEECLLATVPATDSGSTTGALINCAPARSSPCRTSRATSRLETIKPFHSRGWQRWAFCATISTKSLPLVSQRQSRGNPKEKIPLPAHDALKGAGGWFFPDCATGFSDF